jgi:hypothetical protein
MSPIRHRPSGFDARPERPSSLRAQAQRVFRKTATTDENLTAAAEQLAGAGEPQPTALTRQVRALYEEGVVPVREIARFANVSERTIYKHVAKGGWRRRYGGKGLASAVAKRAATRKATARAGITAKGAGGRFVRVKAAAEPQRRGLKALDPSGEARALARVSRAAVLSEDALKRAERLRESLSDARSMAALAGMLHDLAAIEDAEAAARFPARNIKVPASAAPERDVEAMRSALARKLEAWVKTQDDRDAG